MHTTADARPQTGPALQLVSADAGCPPTWEEAVEEFREHKLLEGREPGTVGQYVFALNPLRRWMLKDLGHDDVSRLTEADARLWLTYFREHGARGKKSEAKHF